MATIQIVDIVRSFVDQMVFTFRINGVFTTEADNITNLPSDQWRITGCKTYALTTDCVITIDGEKYTIVDFENNEYIIVQGPVEPTAESFELEPILYDFGTIMEGSKQYQARLSENIQSDEPKDLSLLIYFHEIVDEDFNYNKKDKLERRSPCRIFFLSDFDGDPETEDFLKNYRKPLTNLVDEFVEIVDNTSYINNLEIKYGRRIAHNSFSVYKKNSGATENLFDATLSAIELNITLPINKSVNSCGINLNCK